MRTAKAHRKFAIYSIYLDTMLEGEEEIQDGETRKEVLLRIHRELEETAADLRKSADPHLYQESKTTDAEIELSISRGRSYPVASGPTSAVINIQHERIQIAIENAQTIEDLRAIEKENIIFPPHLLGLYDKRFAELSKPTK